MALRKSSIALIVAAGVLGVLLAVWTYPRISEPPASLQPQYGGALRIGQIPPASLDPIEVSSVYEAFLINQIHEGLVEYDASLSVVPGLAERWEISGDRRTYRFYLREGLLFHSGRPVRAGDAVASFQRLIRRDAEAPTAGHGLLGEIAGVREYLEGDRPSVSGIRAISDRIVEFRLNRPSPDFLALLASDPLKIVGPGGEGAGPFRPGAPTDSVLHLRAFDDYYRGRPFLDSLVVLIDPDWEEEREVEAFERGRVDIIELPAWEWDRFRDRDDVALQRRQGMNLEFLGFNLTHPALSDPGTRRAVAESIDWDTLFADAGPLFRRATSLIPPGMVGFRDRPSLFKDRRASGRSRAARADRAVEYMVVGTPGFEYEEDMSIVAALEAVGLQVDYQPVSWDDFNDRIESGRAEIFMMAWVADLPSAPLFLYDLFHSEGWGNYFNYRNAEVDSLIERSLWETVESERIRLAQRAEDRILEDLPIIPIDYAAAAFGVRRGLEDVRMGPLGLGQLRCELIWWHR